jgi:cell division protein FtsB
MPHPNSDRNQLAIGIVAVIALAFVVGVVWGFGQQIVRARQMQAEEARLERVVKAKQVYHDKLVAQLEYVRSDEYVEQWAREDVKMARPGEVLIIVPDDPDEEPVDDTPSTSTAESEPRPFWVEWWELIFTPSDR